MKRFLLVLATTATMLLAGCGPDVMDSIADLNDYVDQLEERIAALEQRCQTMNDDIATLQELVSRLQGGTTIADVTTLTDGGGKVVGYTITFSNGDTEMFREIFNSLVYGGDEYFVLKDFDSYCDAHLWVFLHRESIYRAQPQGGGSDEACEHLGGSY